MLLRRLGLLPLLIYLHTSDRFVHILPVIHGSMKKNVIVNMIVAEYRKTLRA